MRSCKAVIFLLLALPGAIPAFAQTEAVNGPPGWFTEDVTFHTQAGGRWLADNAAYKSEQEPWDYYAVEWQAGPGNNSMSGRLYALKDGVQSKHDFWSFHQYWNPASQQAVFQQSGWGAFGVGQLRRGDSEREFILEQLFTDFDGGDRREGHRFKQVDKRSYDTWAYSIKDDGTQEKGRYYRWANPLID